MGSRLHGNDRIGSSPGGGKPREAVCTIVCAAWFGGEGLSDGPAIDGSLPEALGTHLLLELNECDSGLLDELDLIETAMVDAAREAGATILGRSFHKFTPRGVTGIVAIAESHLAIHTWPEHQYAAVDIFTCGNSFAPDRAAQLIIGSLKCRNPITTTIRRGPVASGAAAAL